MVFCRQFQIRNKLLKCEAIRDVNFQISREGLSHPARVLTNQIMCFTVVVI